MKKFWNWIRVKNQTEPEIRTLFLNGTIAEDSWFDDDVTPKLFKDELNSGTGDITVWINSPGGDCFAAAQIYNMLKEYDGTVSIKIDGIAASAASVIAMAGDKVYMSPVSMLMIHNPATIAFGDHKEFEKAIDMLNEVKESIINAYELKTGLSRTKLAHLMDEETWMDANKAIELGFADEMIKKESDKQADDLIDLKVSNDAFLFSSKAVSKALINKLEKHYGIEEKATEPKQVATGRKANELRERIDVLKKLL